jgi:hypothetical protein
MCVIRVGGEERDYFSITLLHRAYPDAHDYWDGNWLRSEVEVVVGGFRGRVAEVLRADELAEFSSQLARLIDTLQGTAEFRTMEHWLELTVTSDRRGHLTLSGELRDEPGLGNILSFSLEYDQTYFRPMSDGLRDAVERFPVIGQPPG